jgi:ubiquinone/menaquinone biosynthesis C-methylase UbiE
MYRRLRPRATDAAVPASGDYTIFQRGPLPTAVDGWHAIDVAERQHAAFQPLLQKMREGSPRRDFAVLAEAVALTGLVDPIILETGCGSGWNRSVLQTLLGRPVRYIGADYSSAMTAVGRRAYPDQLFVAGDATSLPFRDACCDIVVSGTCLMHIAEYDRAITELRRVTRAWCIVHTVTVFQQHATITFQKKAYGGWTTEIVFSEPDLIDLLKQNGLRVRWSLDSIAYDLSAIVGEKTVSKTYVCDIVN